MNPFFCDCHCCKKPKCETVVQVVSGPQGPAGSVGPQGPAGEVGPQGTSGIGSIPTILTDFDRNQFVASDDFLNLGVVVNNTGNQMQLTNLTTITVQPGSYFVFFSTLVSNASASGDIGASLIVNDVLVDTASEYFTNGSTQHQMVLQHCFTVSQITTIRVQNLSSVTNIYHDASLSVFKIG